MKRWLRMVFLFPLMLLMGNLDDGGTTGDSGDQGADSEQPPAGDDQGADEEQSGAGTDDGGHDGGDNGADNGDLSQEQQTQQTAPVIPRKAYESEKEKRQRAERERDELKEQLSKAAPKQPTTIEEAFDMNPAEVMAYLDREMLNARAAYDQEKLEELRDQKNNLLARAVLNAEHRTSRETAVAKINAEIYKAVPDFEAKRSELVQLAEDYGLNKKEAEDILNPLVVGETAARMAKMLNKVHAIANAGKTAKGKEVKQPNRVESAGNGGFNNNNGTNAQLTKAKTTGHLDDWAAILG